MRSLLMALFLLPYTAKSADFEHYCFGGVDVTDPTDDPFAKIKDPDEKAKAVASPLSWRIKKAKSLCEAGKVIIIGSGETGMVAELCDFSKAVYPAVRSETICVMK